jgi:hypothetical protein
MSHTRRRPLLTEVPTKLRISESCRQFFAATIGPALLRSLIVDRGRLDR